MKVVICIFFFALGALCSEVELVQVIHFMRHGARTPNSFEYKPQQYLEKQGELTLLGLLQGYLTGKELRERYIEKAAFLSKELNPNEVYIKSSYKSRTLGTATAFLNGLYPQAEGKTLNNPFAILGHDAIPLKNKHRDIKPEDLLNFTINEEWARTHIDVASKEKDHFYHAYKNGNCPLAEFLIDQHLLTPEAIEAEEFFTENLYPTMEWQINTVLGEEKINKELLNIKKAKKILDNFRCNTFHKQEHPRFNNLTVALLKALMQYQVYIATFKDEFIRNVATTRIFESILNFTQKIVGDQTNTPKFVLYSGHDTNLEPMLYNLLSQDEILSREEYTIIPFASVLSLHVYKEKIEGRIDHYVEVTFNDRALSLDWCSVSKCPLSTFQEKLQKHIILDLVNACAHQDATVLP